MVDLTLRTVRDDEDYAAFTAALYSVFLEEPQPDELALARKFTDLDRMFGFHDGTRWAATAGDFRKEVCLPGGELVPVAAVTVVTVSPAHRRRGLLTRMMRHQLDTIRAREDESLAMLFASESMIYGRFGYGMASQNAVLSGQVRDLDFRPEVELGSGTVAETDAATLMTHGPAIFDRVLPALPGRMSRPRPWWDDVIYDNEARRRDSGRIRFALHHEPDGSPTGYAIYRPKSSWSSTGPNAELHIAEVRATNPRAYARLWRFLLEMDLVRSITFDGAAVDDPLRQLVADPRALQCRLQDGVFVRLVEVDRALALRRYACPVDIVLDVRDEFCPWNAGGYRLRADIDGAECEKTTTPADLTISARDLGAIYLGGVSVSQLVTAGLVAERTPGSAHRAAAAFGWPVAPAIPDHF
ncbi:GNAT family N-acetyltransferase [Mycobacterium sp. AMU20-3851]|uniref:GNAT family N-acetyltransferase n=1 Tax=Mycobacterium sp. AMU20-3851 TaxID=3122055 RepID=UPI0037540C7C